MILYLFGGHVMWLCTVEHLVTNMSCLIIMFSFHPWIIGFDFCLFIQTMIVFLASMSYSLNIIHDSLFNFPNYPSLDHWSFWTAPSTQSSRTQVLVLVVPCLYILVRKTFLFIDWCSRVSPFRPWSSTTRHQHEPDTRGNGFPLFHLPRITRPITVKTGLLSLALSMEVT